MTSAGPGRFGDPDPGESGELSGETNLGVEDFVFSPQDMPILLAAQSASQLTLGPQTDHAVLEPAYFALLEALRLKLNASATFRAIKHTRENCRLVLERVEAHGIIGFRAALLTLRARAAHFCHWLCEVNHLGSREDALGWLVLGWQDLVAIEGPLPPKQPEIWASRLACEITWVWSRQRELERAAAAGAFVLVDGARRLARCGDELVPIGADLPMDKPLPTENWNALLLELDLGNLSSAHGSARAALQRAEAVLAKSCTDPELAWAWQRASLLAASARARIGSDATHQAEAFVEASGRRRIDYRSRVGRLWEAQLAAVDASEALETAIAGGVLNPNYTAAVIESLKARGLLDDLTAHEQAFHDPGLQATAQNLELGLINAPRDDSEIHAVDDERWTDVSLAASGLSRDDWDLLRQDLQIASLLPLGRFGLAHDVLSKPVREKIEQIESLNRQASAGLLDAPAPATLAQIQALLGDDELLLQYFQPRSTAGYSDHLIVSVTTKHSVRSLITVFRGFSRIQIDDFDMSPVTLEAARARGELIRGEDEQARARLRTLYDWLLKPVEEAGFRAERYRRWLVSPSASTYAVPFGALLDGSGQHLIDRVAVVLVPSGSVWRELASRPRRLVSRVLAIGDPDTRDSSLPRISHAIAELDRVRAACEGSELAALTHAAATADRVRREIAHASVVHLAAHGHFPPDRPFNEHSVRLAPSEVDDGHLRAECIRGLDLSSTRLVVLSICEGGAHRVGPGDEPYGLVAAFLAAGAENVIAPLWKVHDQMTLAMMTDFYRELVGNDPGYALQMTCRSAIADGWPIGFWASFQLFGTGRSNPLRRGASDHDG